MSLDINASKLDARNQLRAVTSSSDVEEPLALLDLGDVNFLIPSKDIVTLMSIQEITVPTLSFACGEVTCEFGKVPIFAINKALQLKPELSSNHLTVVVLRHQALLFGLCCVNLKKIEARDLKFFAVPINMSSRKQPFSQFAIVDNYAAGLTNALSLSRLLDARGVVFSVTSDVKCIRGAS